MMNNNKNNIFQRFHPATIIGLFLILLSGCSEVIEWDVEDSAPQLVVEGVVTSEYKQHYVYVSSTQKVYGEKDSAGISDAIVTISDGEKVFTLEESTARKGFYETSVAFSGEPGKTYELNVELPEPVGGIQNIHSTTTMPHLLEMDSIQVISETILGTETYSIKLFGKDPAETANYYLMYIYRNGELYSDDLDELVFFDNENVEGLEFDDFTIYSDDQFEEGDSIKVELQSITEDYYDYLSDLVETAVGGDPLGFSGPPSNVYGNISNDALGYFYATPVSTLEGVAKQE